MNTMSAAVNMFVSAQQSGCAAFSCPDAANGMIIILDASLLLASIFVLSIALLRGLLALLDLLAVTSTESRRTA